MFGLGATELIIIMLVVLLLFGPKRLPDMAKSLGTAINDFKRATNDAAESATKSISSDSTRKSA